MVCRMIFMKEEIMQMEPEDIEIRRDIVDRLKKKIVIAESRNLKQKDKSDSEMVKDIKKWIEEEIQCFFKQ